MKFRVGRKVGRTVYIQRGEAPSDDDELVGLLDLAATVVAALNEGSRNMPAHRKPVPPTTVGGLPVAQEPFAGATAPTGETVTLKAQGPKPGWTTTEFWIALAPLIGAALTVFHVTAAPAQVRDALIAVAGVVGAAYALSRGIVKAAHSKAVAARQLPAIRGSDSDAGLTLIELLLAVIIIAVLVWLVVFLAHN